MIKSPERKKKERHALRMLLLVSQIGITMMVPVFFCVFVGRFISDKTGHPILFLLFLLIGVLAGFRSSWQIISRFTGLTLFKKQDTGGGIEEQQQAAQAYSPYPDANGEELEDEEDEDFIDGGFPP